MTSNEKKAMLIDYIGKFNGLTRKQINDYMIPEIRGELSIEEKMRKITNLLTYLRQKGEIKTLVQIEKHCGYCQIPM